MVIKYYYDDYYLFIVISQWVISYFIVFANIINNNDYSYPITQ
jgi:hypothetical protein